MSVHGLHSETEADLKEKEEEVFDLIRSIRDPEKEATLEELLVVRREDVSVGPRLESPVHPSVISTDLCPHSEPVYAVAVGITPTVTHCSLATLIGLCVLVRLEENLYFRHKLVVRLKEGSHDTPDEVNKQLNDKERVAAAMENPDLAARVRYCIRDPS